MFEENGKTEDGFHWTAGTGLEAGLPCDGVALPSQSPNLPSSYDVIVIGAGFAGLVASRDLALRGTSCLSPIARRFTDLLLTGFKTLLLEARDRIGGRTWTSVVNGFPFEMGGAWIHWNQPHTYSQITRYDMKDQIKSIFDLSGGLDASNIHYKLGAEEPLVQISHEDEDLIYGRAAELYFNVDGQMGCRILPFPHDPFFNPEIYEYDHLTAFDRLEQIRDQLTSMESAALEGYILLMSGGTPGNSGFLDMLRWWALCDYRSDRMRESGIAYKMKCGTTGLAKRIFEDGYMSTNLAFKLRSPVESIFEQDGTVFVSTNEASGGIGYQSRQVISTIPLNVLKSVRFMPPLGPAKEAAIQTGHIGLHSKVHFEALGPELRSWSGYAYPGRGLLYAYGDDTLPSSNTHIVSFGAAEVPLHAAKDVEKTKEALLHLRADINIQRVLFHDWVEDPYAKGSWCMFGKDYASRYLKPLQERHGNVWFASADWADGWRGFIDGAIEQGVAVAQRVADTTMRR